LILGSEEPGEDAGLLEGAVLLERRKEMQRVIIAKPIPNWKKFAQLREDYAEVLDRRWLGKSDAETQYAIQPGAQYENSKILANFQKFFRIKLGTFQPIIFCYTTNYPLRRRYSVGHTLSWLFKVMAMHEFCAGTYFLRIGKGEARQLLLNCPGQPELGRTLA
jgi:hypothetical protein